MSYRDEARALDADLLAIVVAWHRDGQALDDRAFDDLALRILAHQLRYNEPYATYCASLGTTLERMPATWRAIPPVPTDAYKEATLCTFEASRAELTFETSGTTRGLGGRHYMETRELYDAALLAAFDRFMLPDGARLRYLNLVPNPLERPQSSLGYMMRTVSKQRGDGRTGWYLRGDDLLCDAFVADLNAAVAERKPVCIAGTAFAFVSLLDELAAHDAAFTLPTGSRVLETGGFKGRTRTVPREELYAQLAARFAIPEEAIVAEYGMTELTSQYYDTILRQAQDDKKQVQDDKGTPVTLSLSKGRVKRGPAWLRTRVLGADGNDVPPGIIGSLVHVDLCNRSSCVAIATQDLGALTPDGLVLIGRDHGAELRGCSLDAELLRVR